MKFVDIPNVQKDLNHQGNQAILNQNPKVSPVNPVLSNKPVALPPENLNFGKKSANGKLIATIFSIILLLVGVAAGVLLVGQKQEIRERAKGFESCATSTNCQLLEQVSQTQTYEARSDISYIIIATPKLHQFDHGVSDDGCFRVTISKNVVMWDKYGKEGACGKIINIQIWGPDLN